MGAAVGLPWYRQDADALHKLRGRLEESRPEMEFVDEGARVLLRGEFKVRSDHVTLDSFDLEVVIADDSSRAMPTVFEVAGRIPHRANCHVYSDGSACIVLPDAYWWVYPHGLELNEYLDGPVTYYYAAQAAVELGREWPAGEYGHGDVGILEFYSKTLDVEGSRRLVRLLDLVAGDRKLPMSAACPCGSGSQIHVCHGRVLGEMRERIPRNLRRQALSAARLQYPQQRRRIGRPWPRNR